MESSWTYLIEAFCRDSDQKVSFAVSLDINLLPVDRIETAVIYFGDFTPLWRQMLPEDYKEAAILGVTPLSGHIQIDATSINNTSVTT